MKSNTARLEKTYTFTMKKGMGDVVVQLLRNLSLDNVSSYRPVGIQFADNAEKEVTAGLYETKFDLGTELQKLTFVPKSENSGDWFSINYEFKDTLTVGDLLECDETFDILGKDHDEILTRTVNGEEKIKVFYRLSTGVHSDSENREFLESVSGVVGNVTGIASIHSPVLGITSSIIPNGYIKETVAITIVTNGMPCDEIIKKGLEMVGKLVEDLLEEIH